MLVGAWECHCMLLGTRGITGCLWALPDAHRDQGHLWVLARTGGITGCSWELGHCHLLTGSETLPDAHRDWGHCR